MDFWRGLIPTVCANMYIATDLWPDSSSRLQRRQYKVSKSSPSLQCGGECVSTPLGKRNIVCLDWPKQVRRKIPANNPLYCKGGVPRNYRLASVAISPRPSKVVSAVTKVRS